MTYILASGGLLLCGTETTCYQKGMTLAFGILQELCYAAREYRVDAVLRPARIYLWCQQNGGVGTEAINDRIGIEAASAVELVCRGTVDARNSDGRSQSFGHVIGGRESLSGRACG